MGFPSILAKSLVEVFVCCIVGVLDRVLFLVLTLVSVVMVSYVLQKLSVPFN